MIPLTPLDEAQKVYVVTDDDGNICGSFYSVNRACLYIKDWLSMDKDNPTECPNEATLVAIRTWTYADHWIYETEYRV